MSSWNAILQYSRCLEINISQPSLEGKLKIFLLNNSYQPLALSNWKCPILRRGVKAAICIRRRRQSRSRARRPLVLELEDPQSHPSLRVTRATNPPLDHFRTLRPLPPPLYASKCHREGIRFFSALSGAICETYGCILFGARLPSQFRS
jgi:hypothetical protein